MSLERGKVKNDQFINRGTKHDIRYPTRPHTGSYRGTLNQQEMTNIIAKKKVARNATSQQAGKKKKEGKKHQVIGASEEKLGCQSQRKNKSEL